MDHHKTLKIIMNNKFNILVSAAILVSTVYYLWLKFRKRNSRMNKKKNLENDGIEDGNTMCPDDTHDNSLYADSNDHLLDSDDNLTDIEYLRVNEEILNNNNTQLLSVDDTITDKNFDSQDSLNITVDESNTSVEESFTAELCSKFDRLQIATDTVIESDVTDKRGNSIEFKLVKDTPEFNSTTIEIIADTEKSKLNIQKEDIVDDESLQSNIHTKEFEQPICEVLEEGEILEDDCNGVGSSIYSNVTGNATTLVDICLNLNEALIINEEKIIENELEDGEISSEEYLLTKSCAETSIEVKESTDLSTCFERNEEITSNSEEISSKLTTKEDLEDGEILEDNACTSKICLNENIEISEEQISPDDKSSINGRKEIENIEEYINIHTEIIDVCTVDQIEYNVSCREEIDLTHDDAEEESTENILKEEYMIDLTNEDDAHGREELTHDVMIDLTNEDEENSTGNNIEMEETTELNEIEEDRSEVEDSKSIIHEHSINLSNSEITDKPSSESAYESEESLNVNVDDYGVLMEQDADRNGNVMIKEVTEVILSQCASSTSVTIIDETVTETDEVDAQLNACCTKSESREKSECEEVLTDDSKGEESLETYGYVLEDEDNSLDNMVMDRNIMDYIDKCLNEPDRADSGSKDARTGCTQVENWQNDEDSLNNIKRDFYELTDTVCSPHPSSESDHAHCVNNLTERVATHSAESILDNVNAVSTNGTNSEDTATLSSSAYDDSSPELFVEKMNFGGKEMDVVYFDESILEQGGIMSDVRILRTIPVGISGRIIGKKGKTKNDLQKRYGAELLIYNHPSEQCKQVLQITCSPSLQDDLEQWVDKTLEQILKNTIQTTVSNPEWLKPMIPIGKMVPVQIIDMPTIQHVKLRIYDPKMIRAYNKMQSEINADYSLADSNAILPSPVAVGCICIAMIRPDYFLRAEIISIYDQYAVVYLYDLGKTHQTCLFYLFKIREKYMKLPFQVIPARMPHAVIKNKKFTSAMVHKRFLCDQKTQRPHIVRAFFPRMNTCCEPCVHIYLPRSAIDGTDSKNDCVDLLELLVSVDVCGMVRETVNCDLQARMNENHFKNSLSEKEKKHSLTTPVYYEPCNNKFYEDFIEFQFAGGENE